MKAMKGRLLKKLKTMKTMGHLKTERVLYLNASDGYIRTSEPESNAQFQTPLVSVQVSEEPKKLTAQRNLQEQEQELELELELELEIIDVSELMKDLEDQEMELEDDINDKENIRPDTKMKKSGTLRENQVNLSTLKLKIESLDVKGPQIEFLDVKGSRGGYNKVTPLSEINFRRPDLDSSTPFHPNLLYSFHEAAMDLKGQDPERRVKIEEKVFEGIEEMEGDEKENVMEIEEITDPMLEFEEKCPPGGSDSVVLYTTGLRGIRKTFEDCQNIKFMLGKFGVMFFERDISMHSEYKEELWRVLDGKLVPPRLFIKGRYIGGAEEVMTLHEQGRLRPLLEGIPIDLSQGPCEVCAGIKFIVCFRCNGCQKIVRRGEGELIRCPECNENGLIICPFCC